MSALLHKNHFSMFFLVIAVIMSRSLPSLADRLRSCHWVKMRARTEKSILPNPAALNPSPTPYTCVATLLTYVDSSQSMT